MPIHVDVSHANRIIVAVIRGTVTPEEVTDVVRQFLLEGENLLHYRKIIDVSFGVSTFDESRLQMLAALARANAQDKTRGPLAFVVDPERAEMVEKFINLTDGERPVKAFRSIHEARRWLDANTPRR